jgi:membrane protease YdiL (CAAX protease family)
MQNNDTNPDGAGPEPKPLPPQREGGHELRYDARDDLARETSAPPQKDEIPTAELIPPTPSRPRVFVAVLVGILAIPTAAVVAGVALFAGGLLHFGPEILRPDPEFFRGESSLPRWIGELAQTRMGLLVMVVPGQLVFFAAAVGAAALSPERFSERLALRRGVLPLWTWAALIVATPIIGLGSSIFLSLFLSEPSDQLRMMTDMMETHAKTFLPGLLLLIAVVPGLVEELLFRGYLQSRLLKSWPPVGAICFSAFVFAAAHMDPVHVLGVLPLGFWLGVIAWRADSVWPAMLCHAANNLAAVLGVMYGDPHTMEITFDPLTVTTLAVSGPAFLLALFLLFRAPSRTGQPGGGPFA